MISIKVNGKYLVFSPGVKVRFTLVNPLFADEVGHNSDTLSFPIPIKENQHIFEFAESVLKSTENTVSYECIVLIGTSLWKRGVLTISGIDWRDYQVSIQLDTSELVIKFADKKVNEYSYGGVREISVATELTRSQEVITHANETTTGDVNTHDYVFAPIYNPRFYNGFHPSQDGSVISGTQFDEPEYMNHWEAGSFLHNWPPNLLSGVPLKFNKYFLCPFPYLIYVLKQHCLENGFVLDETVGFPADPEMRTLAIYNNCALDETTTFEVAFTGTTFFFEVNQYQGSINIQNHVPDVNTAEFWGGLCRMFNLAIITTGNVVKLLFRQDIINASNSTDVVDWTRKSLIGYRQTIEVNKGLKVFYELDDSDELQDTPYVKEISNEITGEIWRLYPAASPPGFLNVGDVYLQGIDNAYYRFSLVEETNPAVYKWEFLTYNTFAQGDPDGKEQNTEFSTLQMIERDEGGDIIRTPHALQMGSSNEFQLGKNPFSPRLLFYRGIINYSGVSYPFLSADDSDAGYTYSLQMNGANGLYNSFWIDYNTKRKKAKILQQDFNLSIVDIMNLDWTKSVRIRLREGDTITRIRKLEFDIQVDRDKLAPVNAELMLI